MNGSKSKLSRCTVDATQPGSWASDKLIAPEHLRRLIGVSSRSARVSDRSIDHLKWKAVETEEMTEEDAEDGLSRMHRFEQVE